MSEPSVVLRYLDGWEEKVHMYVSHINMKEPITFDNTQFKLKEILRDRTTFNIKAYIFEEINGQEKLPRN